MVRRLGLLVLLSVGMGVSAAPAAPAADALVAIDTATPELASNDGEWSGTVGITNLSAQSVELSIAPPDGAPADCKPVLSRTALGASVSRDVTLTVRGACHTGNEAFEPTLVASAGGTRQELSISPMLGPSTESDWNQLLVFPIALVVAGLVLLALCAAWGKLRCTLEFLEASYDFKESWINNVTFIGGLLTALFGSSSVVQAILGEDADRWVALATVGSAIAVILIGIGPIVLTAAKRDAIVDGEAVPAYTGYGLWLATTVGAAGAAGQLWIGAKTGRALDLGGAQDWIGPATVLAGMLLVWYTLATFHATLKAGTTRPTPPGPSDMDRLVAVLELALKANDAVDNRAIPTVLKEVVAASEPVAGAATPTVAQMVQALEPRLRANGAVPDEDVPDILREVVGAAPLVTGVVPVGQRRTAALL